MTIRIFDYPEKTYKSTFIHVPKNGGTSINYWMINNIVPKFPKNNSQILLTGKLRHCCPADAKMKRSALGWTFCTFRNPYDRVISYYFFLLGIHKSRKRGSKTQTWDKILSEVSKGPLHIGIPKLVDYCREQAPRHPGFRNFFSSQLYYLKGGIDHVMRFETLKRDFKKVQEFYHCFEPLPHANRSDHTHYSEYYNDDLKRYVSKLYEEELERLEYRFESKPAFELS